MSRIASFGIFGFAFLIACQKPSQSGSERQAVPVKLVPVVVRFLSEPVRTSGYLTSEAESKLSFKTGGLVDRITVEEGERVRKGQVLAALKLAEIQAMAEQARNGYEKARRDCERAQNLYRDSVATLEQAQNAQTGLNVARANLEIAEFNFSHSKITAPSDGRVLKKLVEENELIGPGYPVFVFGTDGSEWTVKVGVSDRDVVRLSPGDSVSVQFDAFPGRVFAGKIKTVAGAPNPLSGMFEVSADIQKDGLNFVNGLMADVELFPSAKKKYAVIPFEALTEVTGLQGTVFTLSKDSLAHRIPVRIGFLEDQTAAVEQGLENIHQVVSDGAAYLSDGMPARVIQE